MSNQEAIALLRNLEDSLDSYYELNEEGKTAFRMAIEALNCSEFPNNSDTISRQAAIEVVDAVWSVTGDKNVAKVWDQIKDLPSAEKPFKLPEIYVAEGFDTVEDEDGNIGFGVYVPAENKIYVAGDVEDEIRARALLHEVCHWVQDMCGRPFDEDEANEFSDIVYDALPSAQPEKEKAKRVLWTGWKGCRDTRYKCPNCKKPVKNDDIYCHRCGQKLMFPHISFTDYIPGEKQKAIVRWDDE